MIAFALTLLIAPVPEPPLSKALKELQGEWQAISVEEGGEAFNKKETLGFVIEISDDTLIYKRNAPVEKFRIELSPDNKPAWIDLRLIAENVDPTKRCHAIYALEKDKLKLCLYSEFTANDLTERPSKFETAGKIPPHGKLLIVLERIKKK
jgi:uncharacterized protein (TIGR03067 family)